MVVGQILKHKEALTKCTKKRSHEITALSYKCLDLVEMQTRSSSREHLNDKYVKAMAAITSHTRSGHLDRKALNENGL